MVAQRRSCLVLLLSFVLSAGSAQAVLLDDFNRPNSPALGADWIQDVGDGFRIEYGKARAEAQSLALWDGSPPSSAPASRPSSWAPR